MLLTPFCLCLFQLKAQFDQERIAVIYVDNDEDEVSFNPLVTNGLSHLYHLDESTFIYRGTRSFFYFISQ